MKKSSLFVVLTALLSAFLPIGAQPAEAQSPSPWQTGRWRGVGTTAVLTTLSGPLQLHVTDFQCIGDRFTVFIDGTAVGVTSAIPEVDLCGAKDPDEACADGRFSSGSFSIPEGSHSVEIRHLEGLRTGSVAYRTGSVGCVGAAIASESGRGLTALCIEDVYVQTNGQGRRAGDQLLGAHDDVLITTGAPSCAFNCVDGFDLDCDGRIGDFCPVELDRSLVDNVQPCLEASAAGVQLLQPHAAPPASTVPDSTLAHTGVETKVLGMFGAAMLTYGSIALGCARHARRRPHGLSQLEPSAAKV